MVHDYVKEMSFSHPMRYAENYYLHYPQVAIGHWPPGFYILTASYMLVFGTSPVSILLCMAIIAAVFAEMIYRIVRADFGAWLGLAAALAVLGLPAVQKVYDSVLSDILVAILSTGAALVYGKYLESGRYRHALAFALFASMGIMTKGSALHLVMLPPLVVIFAKRYDLLRKASFWLPVVVVGVLCGSWYMLAPGVATGFKTNGFDWEYTRHGLVAMPMAMAVAAGWGLGIQAVLGVIGRPWPSSTQGSNRRISLIALAIAAVVLSLLVPSGYYARYAFAALPAIALLAVGGAVYLVGWLTSWNAESRRSRAVAVAVLLVPWLVATVRIPQKESEGYRNVAAFFNQHPELNDHVILAAADGISDHEAVVEFALAEDRPGHVVLRSMKTLARSDWRGRGYQLLLNTREEVTRWLDEVPVGIVLFERSYSPEKEPKHYPLLDAAVRGMPEDWECIARFDRVIRGERYPDAIEVYRRVGYHRDRDSVIKLDMSHTLGRSIEVSTSDEAP
jgi:hypothetical protein